MTGTASGARAFECSGLTHKFAAALQQAQAGPGPILLQVETQTGHGLGSTLERKAQQNADILAFIAESLGVSLAPPPASAAHRRVMGPPRARTARS